MLKDNVKVFEEGLNEDEIKILEGAREKLVFKNNYGLLLILYSRFLIPLNYKGYGNIDVIHYWEKIDEIEANK